MTTETEIKLPRSGDREFWLDFNAAYLNRNKLCLTAAWRVAVFAMHRRDPSATPPSVSQARRWIKSLPPEIVTVARDGLFPR